jgi:hypothetical protein
MGSKWETVEMVAADDGGKDEIAGTFDLENTCRMGSGAEYTRSSHFL